jgi:hypothetical protein
MKEVFGDLSEFDGTIAITTNGSVTRSARELLKIIEVKKINESVYLPRPGCGNGRLNWEDVKKILSPILKSDQFHIVTYSRTDS